MVQFVTHKLTARLSRTLSLSLNFSFFVFVLSLSLSLSRSCSRSLSFFLFLSLLLSCHAPQEQSPATASHGVTRKKDSQSSPGQSQTRALSCSETSHSQPQSPKVGPPQQSCLAGSRAKSQQKEDSELFGGYIAASQRPTLPRERNALKEALQIQAWQLQLSEF